MTLKAISARRNCTCVREQTSAFACAFDWLRISLTGNEAPFRFMLMFCFCRKLSLAAEQGTVRLISRWNGRKVSGFVRKRKKRFPLVVLQMWESQLLHLSTENCLNGLETFRSDEDRNRCHYHPTNHKVSQMTWGLANSRYPSTATIKNTSSMCIPNKPLLE